MGDIVAPAGGSASTGLGEGPRARVAAIVLNWNDVEATARCLASLRDSSRHPDDTIVVDNGSRSPDAIDSIHKQFTGVRIVKLSRNLGYAGGMNAGIRVALAREADFLWLLNNDVVVAPLALRSALDVAVDQLRVGILGSSQFTSAQPWQDAKPYVVTPDEASGRRRELLCTGHATAEGAPWHRVSAITGAALLLRSSMVLSVGMLDESYFHYEEERDLCERATEAGWQVALACNSHVWHACGSTLKGDSALATYYLTRNQFLLRRNRRGWSPMRTLLSQPRFTLYTVRKLLPFPIKRVPVSLATAQGVLDGVRGRTGPYRHHERLIESGLGWC